MQKLTALKIRHINEPCLLGDGEGLFFELTPSGIKRWIYRYKINGKGGKYTLGRYPEYSLSQAREEHQEVRKIVKLGKNPAKFRRTAKLETQAKEIAIKGKKENTFEYVALDWVTVQSGEWSSNHTQAVLGTLKNDVFTSLGNRQIDVITPPEVLTILHSIEKRGSLEIARKVLQRISSVFRYAIQIGKATYNPAADMRGALKKKTVDHMPAVFNHDLAKLLFDINNNTKLHLTTKLALQLTSFTACRSGEVRGALWSEFNISEGLWSIPAERMKMKRPHIVPLSVQAIAILNRAGVIFGTDGLVFPSVRDSNKPMSDNAMSKALRDMGYRGIATPHGFRSSFSSMAHEKSGFPSEVIEKSLAHSEKNRIKAAYNRAEYLEQRKELMQWWADLLTNLEQNN